MKNDILSAKDWIKKAEEDLANKLYILTRYPFALEFTKAKAEEAIYSAKIVLEKIKSKIV